MSQEPTSSLLLSTGQNRRLRYAGIGFFAGIGVVSLAQNDFVAAAHPYGPFVAAACGAVIAIVCAVFALYTIRCPNCGLRWLRWSIGNRPANDWLHWLYRFSVCPKCGHRAN